MDAPVWEDEKHFTSTLSGTAVLSAALTAHEARSLFNGDGKASVRGLLTGIGEAGLADDIGIVHTFAAVGADENFGRTACRPAKARPLFRFHRRRGC